MLISDLYAKYNQMPQLITHQLRVGGIVALITRDWSNRAIAKDCVLTALVHDLGNIVKFDLINRDETTFGKLDNPERWLAIQKEQREKYGSDAHAATTNILLDAGLTKYYDYIQEESRLFDTIHADTDYSSYSRPSLVTLYADSRATTKGVASLEERIVDLETRYGKRRDDRVWAYKLERHIQEMSTVKVESITERDVRPLFDELLSYNI